MKKSHIQNLSNIIEWLYPPKCAICLKVLPLSGPRGFCAECKDKLAEIGTQICEICGRVCTDSVCECEGQDIKFTKNRSVFRYDDVMSSVIYAFKYDGHPAHGKTLGQAMAERFCRHFEGVDVIIPVPMHKQKERMRGFNQAALLAEEIARYTSIELGSKLLVRVRNTAPQSEVSAAERHKNLLGAFKVMSPCSVKGKTVLVVDDIFTTGSTLNECAAELLRAGAAKVYGYTLAAPVRDKK